MYSAASESLRFAMDQALAIPAMLGVSPYPCYLTIISNGIINFNDPTNQAVRIDRRLTVGGNLGCCDSDCKVDGYFNPQLLQTSGQQLVVAGGALTDDQIMLGPLVAPYCVNDISGGTDPALFLPNNKLGTQPYVWIKGLSLDQVNGNYFEIVNVKLESMFGLSYHVILKATSTVPVLTPST